MLINVESTIDQIFATNLKNELKDRFIRKLAMIPHDSLNVKARTTRKVYVNAL